jgi:hypothetical protein
VSAWNDNGKIDTVDKTKIGTVCVNNSVQLSENS